jgi:hypothetical protein
MPRKTASLENSCENNDFFSHNQLKAGLLNGAMNNGQSHLR